MLTCCVAQCWTKCTQIDSLNSRGCDLFIGCLSSSRSLLRSFVLDYAVAVWPFYSEATHNGVPMAFRRHPIVSDMSHRSSSLSMKLGAVVGGSSSARENRRIHLNLGRRAFLADYLHVSSDSYIRFAMLFLFFFDVFDVLSGRLFTGFLFLFMFIFLFPA